MTLIEPVNIHHLKQVIQVYPDLLDKGYIFENNQSGLNYYNTLYPILGKYLNQINQVNNSVGHIKIKYVPSKNKKYSEGRVYPQKGMGLVAFPRDIRNYLLYQDNKPLVIDFDIKNCHPVIYYQFLLKDGYNPSDLQMFGDYISHRDEWIYKYGSDLKEHIIAVLNCKKSMKYYDETVKELGREIWKSQDWIQSKYKLLHLEDLKSFIYQKNTEIEKQIIDRVIDYAREYAYDPNIVCIYAYDGFAVHRRGVFEDPKRVEDFIRRADELVKTTLDYSVQFVDKPLKINSQFLEFLTKTDTKPKGIVLDTGKYISDLIPENILTDFTEDILIFQSGMGDGKTHKVYNDILKLGGATTISILNRISLIDNIKHDYSFVYSYRETASSEPEGGIHGTNKSVVICSESLYRLTEQTLDQCEYLILDEIMSLLPQMICSETHKRHLQENQQNFIRLIKSVKKIVILDANISEETIEFIKKIRGRGSVKQWTIAPRRNRKIHMMTETETLKHLYSSLKEHKRVFVACSKSVDYGNGIIQEISRKFPSLRCVFINSRTKDTHNNLLSDTDKWKEYDVVMISPCISTGVSCVVRDHFDEVYCFYSRCSTNPLDASQQIGRIRHPKSENVYIYIDSKPNPKYKWIQTPEQVLKNIYYNTHNLYSMNSDCIDTHFDYNTFKRVLQETPRTELFVFNYSTQSYYYNRYEYYLRKALENTYIVDWVIQPMIDTPSEQDAVNIALVKEASKQSKNEYCKEILTSSNITSGEAERLQSLMLHQNNPRYIKFILGERSALSGSRLDSFIQLNSNREFRTLYRVIENRIIPTVKYLRTYIHTQRSVENTEDCTNDLYRLFQSPDKFQLPEFNTDSITTRFLKDNLKGTLVRFHSIEKILKSFGSEFLYHQIRITKEEFQHYFSQWVETLGYNQLHQLARLFDFKDDYGYTHTNRSLKQVVESGKGLGLINGILGTIGLCFCSDSVLIRENGKRKRTSELVLKLKYPVLLNQYLPEEYFPKGLDGTGKGMLNYDKNSIPVLTTGSIPFMSPEWLEQYKQSVFYDLPSIKTTEI
jgi:hypothetical protein